MKIVWSAFVSFLFLLLAFLCVGMPFFITRPLYMNLGAIALGLVFLVTFVNSVQPRHQYAGKLASVLNVCAGGLFAAALVAWLLRSFATGA